MRSLVEVRRQAALADAAARRSARTRVGVARTGAPPIVLEHALSIRPTIEATESTDPWSANKFIDPWYAIENDPGGSGAPTSTLFAFTSKPTGSSRARELLDWPSSADVKAANSFGEVELRSLGAKIAADAEAYREKVKKTTVTAVAAGLSVLATPAVGVAFAQLANWGYPYVVKAFEAVGISIDDSKAVQAAMDATASNIAACFRDGYPPPLTTLVDVRYLGFAGTADLMRDMTFASFQKFQRLPPSAREALKAYMAVRLEMTATDDATYQFMLRIPQTYLANDWQVAAIGYPIARKYGLDPEAFVAALWNRCPGWRGAYDWWERDPEGKTASGVLDGAVIENAAQVQAALIARDAFAIVESRTAPLAPPAERSPKAVILGDVSHGPDDAAATAVSTIAPNGNIVVPLVVGVASAGALALAGAGLLVSVVPIGLALLWSLTNKKKKKEGA